MSDYSNHMRVVELNALDTEYPIIEVGRGAWVTYGESNSYPSYLLDLFLESPTNNAIITATANMIAGDGLEIQNPELNPLANRMLQQMFTPKNLKKLAFNLKLYGYAPVIIKGGKTVMSATVSDASKWRSGKKDEAGRVNEWFYSADWQFHTYKKNKPEPYTVFSYGNVDLEQVFIFKLPMVGLDYYPPVDYNGGTCYIQLEAEIGEFHLSAIQNGLSPSMMLNFNNGIPPDEEQDDIERKVKGKFGGSSKSGKFFLSFNANPENATTVDVLEVSKLDKQYEFLSKESTAKIMLSHRVVSPIMFGIRDGSGLGNNAEELEKSYLMYSETVIRSYQEIILDGLQAILYKNDVEFDASWVDYMPFKKEVATEEAAQTDRQPTLSMFETKLRVAEYTRNTVDVPEGFRLVKEEIYSGQQPKTNGKMTTLYKLVQVDASKRNLLLKQVSGNDKYYPHKFVEDYPNDMDKYWMQCSFVKGK